MNDNKYKNTGNANLDAQSDQIEILQSILKVLEDIRNKLK